MRRQFRELSQFLPQRRWGQGRVQAAVVRKGRQIKVWFGKFGTNRRFTGSKDPSLSFLNEPDPEGLVRFGTCSVLIPKNHVFGQIGTPWWRRLLRFKFRSDRLRLRGLETFACWEQFQAALGSEMGGFDVPDRQVLVFLHGYNVSFKDAALRTGQMAADLNVRGATAFFSWPSCATVEGYIADQERIETSEAAIAEFLVRLAHECASRGDPRHRAFDGQPGAC